MSEAARQIGEREFVEAEMDAIRKSVTPVVKNLSVLKGMRVFFEIVSQWAIVVACAALTLKVSFFFYIPSIFIIAARQHALVGLMHEGVHYRLSKSEWLNNFLSDVFCAFPVVMKTSVYRRHHLLHHRYLNTAQDPDWSRKIGLPEWQFPMKAQDLASRYWKYLYGFGIWENFKLCQYLSGLNSQNLKQPGAKAAALVQVGYYGFAIFWIAYFHLWDVMTLFWLVPACTVFPFIMKLRSVAEHFGLEHTHELNETRDMNLGVLEQFLLIPLNLTYHLSHHLFPTVPFYNLPSLHKTLRSYDLFDNRAHINDSVFSWGERPLVSDLISSQSQQSDLAGNAEPLGRTPKSRA